MARKLTPSEELAFAQNSPSAGTLADSSDCSLRQLERAMIHNCIESKTSPEFPDELSWEEPVQEDWF
ncbi:MAG: hypothetical protein JWQ71_3246 [Pedosphaera sp.]|nr:hypothetical protein [Pedosphaera sp.]